VLDGLASGKLKPMIAKTFPFEKIVDVHRFVESNEQIADHRHRGLIATQPVTLQVSAGAYPQSSCVGLACS
jgi:hypothetical protein